MALSRDERINILSVRLDLDVNEFTEQVRDVSTNRLGQMIKQLGLLERVARDTGHNINTYIAQGFDAAANTAQARIREINNRLQRDIHGTINLSGIGVDAIVDKAHSSMAREHVRYTSGGLADATFENNQLRGLDITRLDNEYRRTISNYGNQIVEEITNAIRRGLSNENIRRIYGNEAADLIGGGWTGTSDEARLQMATAMANVSTMYDNVDFFGNANDPTQKASMVDQLGRKAIGTIQDANNTLNQFYEKLGSLVERQRLNFNKIGELESIDSILNIGGGKKAHMRFTAREMQSIQGLTKPEELISWVRNNSQYITETHSDNEMAQQEQYKKLLIQEYDLELKINQAEREGNEQQVIELNRQRELVRLKQQELNDYRATQIDGDGRTREALTRTHGNISDTDSIAYLNERLSLRNQEINATNAQAYAEQQALSQTTQREQELIRLLNEENNAQQRLSTLKEGSDERIRLQNRIDLIRQEQQAYSDLARYAEIVNQTRTSNFSRQGEEEVVNRLMTLENQRQEAWVKSYTLRQKGNNDESQQYQNIARNMGALYQTELQLARTNNVLSQSSIDALDAQRRSSQQEQEIIKSRQRDLEIQRQQNDTYKSLTSDLNKYLNLLKEKSKLETTKDYKSSGVFGNAYANVNSQIQTLTQSFGNLISVQNDGKLSIASWADTLGITREQYDKLALSVQDTNQKITDNQIKVKQEQDLQTINKMVEAYTRLKTAQMQLQQGKDRNYNDAEIARRTREVQLAEEHFNKLKQENSELAKSETYRNAIANADNKMATSISYTNQNMTQQLTLLQRLRNNLQRTAAVAFNFNIFNRIFMQLRQGISDVIQKVKDFDKAMTDIQMVTGKTDSSVKQLLANYSELAKELGTTTEAVAEGESVRPLKIL